MKYHSHKSNCFTLTELLVVMVIMIIVMSLVVPAFTSMGAGTAVDSAARMVSTQLLLARNEAVARRAHVAVILPGSTISSSSSDSSLYKYNSFRTAIVEGSGPYTIKEWVQGTDWTFLPIKTTILTVHNAKPALLDASNKRSSSNAVPSGNTCSMVSDGTGSNQKVLDGQTNSSGIRAVVFKPNGSCVQTTYITIMEAVNTNGTLSGHNVDNFHVLEVNEYTGKTRFIY